MAANCGTNRKSQSLTVLMLAVLLGAAGSCSKAPPPPRGWKVAQYPVWDDLRHSDAYKADPSVIWAVSLEDGALKLKDWSLHLRGNPEEPEHSWAKSGMSAEAKAAALKFGTYLVEVSPEHALNHLVKVEDGWLVGFDAGEWSGGLCWVSADGSRGKFLITQPKIYVPPPPPPPGMSKAKWDQQTRTPRSVEPDLPGWIPRKNFKIKDYCPENVVLIGESGGAFLIFEGLAHMGLDRGQILKVLRTPTGEWEAGKSLGLDGVPHHISWNESRDWTVITSKSMYELDRNGGLLTQIQLPDALTGGTVKAVVAEAVGRWLLLTDSTLYRLSLDGKSRLLLSGAFVSNPEMNSMVRMPDGTVFIGMRHYLLRLTPLGENFKVERLERMG